MIGFFYVCMPAMDKKNPAQETLAGGGMMGCVTSPWALDCGGLFLFNGFLIGFIRG
jgi:hypothetical protein